MADWSMEVPAVEWMPGELQLANWTTEPAAYALGIPTMEYASSTDIYGSGCQQTSITICDEEQQCGYEIATRSDPNEAIWQESVVTFQDMELYRQNPQLAFKEVAKKCNEEVRTEILESKMHRYPTSITEAFSLNKWYTTPKVVAIGPYYHKLEHLKPAEKMKYVAVHQCGMYSTGISIPDMYQEVHQVAYRVCSHYDKDIMAGVSYDDCFLPMIFLDACFLVQWMLYISDYDGLLLRKMEQSLLSFFNSKSNEILHDIMLLENQIPWPVVQPIFNSMEDFMNRYLIGLSESADPFKYFIYALKECLHDRKTKHSEETDIWLDPSYKPPHLLGLLRHYIVGKSKTKWLPLDMTENISLSVSANKLAEFGIEVKPNKNGTELIHMGMDMKCILGGELFLAPLSLDEARASCLLSMAALEMCTTPNFQGPNVRDEDSAVCSYLLLLAMLVAREEDVQKLRTEHVLCGGGFSDWEVLQFFTKLRGLRLGSGYVRTMQQIQYYRKNRHTRTKGYGFCYRNKKTILKGVGFFSGVGSIIGTIVGFFNKSGS